MKRLSLNPSKIITLNDYPIRSEQILRLYYHMFLKSSRIVPPSPVMHKELVVSSFGNKLSRLYEEFERSHRGADYFLLDGSHKTTAGTLANKKISVMTFESNSDIKEAKRMLERGELMGLTTGSTIKESVEILAKHFNKTGKFWTVEEKTRMLVKDKQIPKYMVSYFKK